MALNLPNPIAEGKRYLLTVGLKKLAKKAASLVVAAAATYGLQQYGVEISDSEKVAGGLFLALEAGRDYLKRRFPGALGWL